MATPRRRSARISRKSSTTGRKTIPPSVPLGSLVERDETPPGGGKPTFESVLSTPPARSKSASKAHMDESSGFKTPRTLPRVEHAEMHPKEMHPTTGSPPDSGTQLGFADIDTKNNTLAAAQNTPSRVAVRPGVPNHFTARDFDFQFAHELDLSDAARKLMHDVREEAEKIKTGVVTTRDIQQRKENEAERIFGGLNVERRKTVKPQGKMGRFSDAHMAQFKKMDSIADHPSSFRAAAGFAKPTQQSLKRSGSKAGLDEEERPHSTRKSVPTKTTPVLGRVHADTGLRKQISGAQSASHGLDDPSPTKRRKLTVDGDSANRGTAREEDNATARPSTLPRPKNGPPASVLTPTKASLARSNTGRLPLPSAGKASLLPRFNSVKNLETIGRSMDSSSDSRGLVVSPAKQSGLVRSESTKSVRPLPPLPSQSSDLALASAPAKPLPVIPGTSLGSSKFGLTSKLPAFQGLKSILRPSRRITSKGIASPTRDTSAGNTPKRGNTAASESGSTKKVDFTPSTKSRHAVKLAVESPSPTKLDQPNRTPPPGLMVPYDPAAYLMDDDSNDEWEDAESEVNYPVLPTGDEIKASTPPLLGATKSFARRAQEHSRRESKEFKSIFTTLEHPSRSSKSTNLTDVNTRVNVQGPAKVAVQPPNVVTRSPSSATGLGNKHSPSTIRPVRSSGVNNLVQPFDDEIKTLPHGLPGKKRRRESDDDDSHDKNNNSIDDRRVKAKDRRKSIMPLVPGAWKDDGKENEPTGEPADEGAQRGRKRARVEPEQPRRPLPPKKASKQVEAYTLGTAASDVKRPNKAREAAARNVRQRKERIPVPKRVGGGGAGDDWGASAGAGQVGSGPPSGRGVLSLARLNVLSRPKERK